MSVHLLGRAFYADLPAHLKLTLLALCDEASEDGSGICIGQTRLARKVGATDRTVRSNLAQLDVRGWIRKLPTKNAKYRTDQWEIDVAMLPTGPETSSGHTPETVSGQEPGPEVERRPDRKLSVVQTGSPLPPTQELPVTTTQEQDHARANGRRLDESVVLGHFVAFYDEAYPRKVGRPKAYTAFLAAVKRGVEPLAIIHGAERFRDDPNREDAFTPHPTTWLHREGWNDGPLPARSGRRDHAADTLAHAAQLREQGR